MVRKADLIKKFGSAEKVSEHYRQLQKKSRENYKGTGGFHADPEFAKKMSAKAHKARWGGERCQG